MLKVPISIISLILEITNSRVSYFKVFSQMKHCYFDIQSQEKKAMTTKGLNHFRHVNPPKKKRAKICQPWSGECRSWDVEKVQRLIEILERPLNVT